MFEDSKENDSITEFVSDRISDKLGEHKIETRDLDEYLLSHKAMLKARANWSKRPTIPITPLPMSSHSSTIDGHSFNLSNTKSPIT